MRYKLPTRSTFVCIKETKNGKLFSDAPRCKKGYEVMRVGVVPYETVVVQCHVDSIPEDVRFSWTYNTSKGVLPVLGAKMQNNGGVSTLHFTPAVDDLESLSCWATNEVGKQKQPCLFYVVPAGKLPTIT